LKRSQHVGRHRHPYSLANVANSTSLRLGHHESTCVRGPTLICKVSPEGTTNEEDHLLNNMDQKKTLDLKGALHLCLMTPNHLAIDGLHQPFYLLDDQKRVPYMSDFTLYKGRS